MGHVVYCNCKKEEKESWCYMQDNIKKACNHRLDASLLEIIISKSNQKELIRKITIRPILLKEGLLFQASQYKGKQIVHKNYKKDQMLEQIEKWVDATELSYPNLKFQQIEIKTIEDTTTILISKKGKATIKVKKEKQDTKETLQESYIPLLSHNRTKKYILKEYVPIPFLIDLGVMTEEGKIISSKYDKFRQINRYLEFIEDILPNLPKEKELVILDFGCGKSYLTFAMYYYLKELKGYTIKVIGLDLKEDVIEQCNQLSRKYKFDHLTFIHGDIASFEGVDSVDMVVSLHACDTATDYALFKAITWNAKVILSVPCCQHEMNEQISCKPLEAILQYGLIKERISALFTDTLRANLLELQGYKTQIIEFIDMEHTPKNILIRAIKTNRNTTTWKQYKELESYLGVQLTLGKLLEAKNQEIKK